MTDHLSDDQVAWAESARRAPAGRPNPTPTTRRGASPTTSLSAALLTAGGAALAVSAVLAFVAWALDCTLMFLVPLVGAAAGAAFTARRRGDRAATGVAVAAITLGAILAGRVGLAFADASGWSDRMSEVTDDDLRSALVEEVAREAVASDELDASEDDYPEWVFDEADDRFGAMDEGERAALRASIERDSREATATVLPILVALGVLRWTGFLGIGFIAIALGTAYRIVTLDAATNATPDEGGTTIVDLAPAAAAQPPMPPMPPLPEDPLMGTAAGERSLTGDERRREAA